MQQTSWWQNRSWTLCTKSNWLHCAVNKDRRTK